MKSKKTIEFPNPEELKSGERKDIVDHLSKVQESLDSAHKRMMDDLSRMATGTAEGQLFYWNGYELTPIDTSNMFWDSTNEFLGIGTSSPTSKLEVDDTVTVKRLLAGGVKLT